MCDNKCGDKCARFIMTNKVMTCLFTLLLMCGISLCLYVGIWVFFIGGIIDIICGNVFVGIIEILGAETMAEMVFLWFEK